MEPSAPPARVVSAAMAWWVLAVFGGVWAVGGLVPRFFTGVAGAGVGPTGFAKTVGSVQGEGSSLRRGPPSWPMDTC